jgi:hypothetical protein
VPMLHTQTQAHAFMCMQTHACGTCVYVCGVIDR